MRYFHNIHSIEELKREYRRLAFQFHPDRGGDPETMKAINQEYEELLKKVGNLHEKADGTTYEDTEAGPAKDDGYREILDILLSLNGLEITLCGSWLWISGNTKQNKETLKASGCKWSSKKLMWYWHPAESKKRHYKSSYTFEEICNKYGAERISGTPRTKQAIA